MSKLDHKQRLEQMEKLLTELKEVMGATDEDIARGEARVKNEVEILKGVTKLGLIGLVGMQNRTLMLVHRLQLPVDVRAAVEVALSVYQEALCVGSDLRDSLPPSQGSH